MPTMPSLVWMRTIGVSCAANDWIASVRTVFGTRSTCRTSTRTILAMVFPFSLGLAPRPPCRGARPRSRPWIESRILSAQQCRNLRRRRHRRRCAHPLHADRSCGIGVSEARWMACHRRAGVRVRRQNSRRRRCVHRLHRAAGDRRRLAIDQRQHAALAESHADDLLSRACSDRAASMKRASLSLSRSSVLVSNPSSVSFRIRTSTRSSKSLLEHDRRRGIEDRGRACCLRALEERVDRRQRNFELADGDVALGKRNGAAHRRH